MLLLVEDQRNNDAGQIGMLGKSMYLGMLLAELSQTVGVQLGAEFDELQHTGCAASTVFFSWFGRFCWSQKNMKA